MLLINLEKVNAQVGPDEALINTLIGMGTVFIVLILISIIIFLLKYIPKLFEKKAAETVRPERREVPIELPKSSSAREESNDTQIAAVIMAAIVSRMEQETGVPVLADDLVIRSIKKRTFN